MTTIDMATAGRQTVLDRVPRTGIMTVNSKAAVALQGGASALAGRRYLKIRNLSETVPARLGGPDATTWKAGEILDPGESVEIWFDQAAEASIYGVSTGAEIELLVTEA